jgi:outer membrane receptor protein involved in Fe transport
MNPVARLLRAPLARPLRLSGFCFAIILGGTSPTLHSQTLPAEETESLVVLSPFNVTATQDAGYQSEVTLSGAGLRVSIDEIASSVSVITAKFLEDTASRDLRDALVYQTGMEVGGFGGNFAGSTNEPRLTNNVSTRVRGLAAAELTRNFFRSAIPNDSYNTARVDINRGANALLFGVGSPAGIVNYSTVEARLEKSARRIGVTVDNFGSVRSTYDANQVLVPDTVAFRLVGLNDEREYKQKPAYNNDRRLYGSLVARIPALEKGAFAGTRITASAESGWIDANNPRNLTPQDHLSGWFEETVPPQWVAAGIGPKGSWDPARPFAAGPVTDRGLGVARFINRSPVAIFVDPTSNVVQDPNGTFNGQTILGRPWVSNNVRFPNGTTGAAVMVASRSFEFSFQNQSIPLPDGEFYIGPRIQNPAVFDFHNLMLDGPNKNERASFRDHSVALEQLLFRRQAGIELAVNTSRFTESTRSLLPIATQWLAIDANTHTWDGTPNPNFGRVMTGQPGTATYETLGYDTVRLKAFAELDFARNADLRWGRILGRHTISGLYQDETTKRENRSGAYASTAQVWTNGNNQSRQSDLGKTLVTVNYLTPSAVNLTNPAQLDIRGIQANRLDLPAILNGQGVFLARVPPATAANAGLPQHQPFYESVEFLRADRELTNMAANAVKSRRKIESNALAIQSRLFDDILLATYGFRQENIAVTQVVAPIIPNGEGYRLVDDPSYDFGSASAVRQVFKDTPTAWSVVVKVPEGLRRAVPTVSSLNLFYGRSENFDPPESTARNVFGQELPPPRGVTTELGGNLRLLNDRLSVRFTRYKTNQEGSFNSGLTSIINNIVQQHIFAFQSVQSGFNIDSDGDGFPDGYVAPPQQLLDLYQVRVDGGSISQVPASAIDTSDFVARGTELELFWAEAPGWSLGMNVSRQQSTRLNSGVALQQFIFETPAANGQPLFVNWNTPAAQNIFLTVSRIPDGTGALSGRMRGIQQSLSRIVNSDGAPATELREWRGNAFASYDFGSGPLRDFGIGGAVRYQSKVAIGLPVATFRVDGSRAEGAPQPGDFRAFDVENPFFGPAETNVDAWFTYRRKLFGERIQARLQLNVRNLINGGGTIPVGTQPTGEVAVVRIGEPTTYTLSARFEF